MSPPHTEVKGRSEYLKHVENVRRKHERIQGLQALILTHETLSTNFDRHYVKELRRKLEIAKKQFNAMK